MPEPTGTAKLAGEILPGVYHFTMHDDRIDFQSDSYAVIKKGKAILIDPLPMAKKELKKLGPVAAICLTGSDRKSTRLNSSHGYISYAVFCLKKKKKKK